MWNPLKNLRAVRDEEDNSDYEILSEDYEDDDYALERGSLEVGQLVAPSVFLVEEDQVRVGDEFCRTLYILTYPPKSEPNWLVPLYRFQEAMDVSLHITPMDSQRLIAKMRDRIARDEARIRKNEEDGQLPNFKIERRYKEYLALVEALESDQTKIFQIATVITLRAKTMRELDRITDALERRLVAATTRQATMRHKDGFISTLPLLQNELADSYSVKNIHTHALQNFFPLTASDIAHETGVLIGVNQATRGNVIVNRFMQPTVENPGMAVFGTSGSGKSYFAKMEMLRWYMRGTPVIVIDPQNEYEWLCEGVGGQFISLALDAPEKINPLDFSYAVDPQRNALADKIVFVIELLQVMYRSGKQDAPPFSDYQRSILDEALRSLYERYGYSVRDIATQQSATWDNMPTLSDLHDLLERLSRANKDEMFQREVVPLEIGLRRYSGDGAFAGLFDNLTSIDLNSPFIVFNIQQIADELLPIAMYLVLEYLRTSLFTVRQQRSGVSRLLYVDEAQRLMKFPETAAFLEHVARTARKFNIGLSVLTQDAEVFLLDDQGRDSRYGIGILQNCATTLLLKQHKNALETVQRVFKLTEQEIITLAGARTGEGIIFVANERAWVTMENMTSPLEHEMITTNASEVAEISGRRDLAALEAAREDRN